MIVNFGNVPHDIYSHVCFHNISSVARQKGDICLFYFYFGSHLIVTFLRGTNILFFQLTI